MTIDKSRYYRPDIDGLRAIAVAAVVLYHGEISCPGGYVGVDIFFVISGFLITRLILQEILEGSFSLAKFWVRRIRRIIPILSVVVATTILLGWVYFWPSDFVDLAESVKSVCFMISNFHFRLDTDYFAGTADSKPLLHTWSLSIEEQFYLVYPLFLLFSLKLIRSTRLPFVLGTIATVSFLISTWTVIHFPAATFYLLPTRVWELLIGGIIAALPNSRNAKKAGREFIAVVGFAAIMIPVLLYDQETQFPGIAAALPVLGTGLLIYANNASSTIIGNLLCWKPLVFLGLISYSLYLWHWPLLVFGRIQFWRFPNIDLITIFLSLILSVFTWRFIELPFRKRSKRYVAAFVSAGAVSSALVALSLVIVHSRGVPGRALAFMQLSGNRQFEAPDSDLIAGGGVSLGSSQSNRHERPDFFIIGDSHASAVLPLINELATKYNLRGVSLARAGRPPFGDNERYFQVNRAILVKIKSERPKNLILFGRWSALFGSNTQGPEYEKNEILLKELVDTSRTIDAYVWIMPQVPWHTIPRSVVRFQQIRAKSNPDRFKPPQIFLDDYLRLSKPALTVFRSFGEDRITLLDLTYFCFGEDGLLKTTTGDNLVYWDDNHLTQSGARLILRPMFENLLREINNTR